MNRTGHNGAGRTVVGGGLGIVMPLNMTVGMAVAAGVDWAPLWTENTAAQLTQGSYASGRERASQQ
ncbi:hypothetical protein ACWEP8_28330 [Streptomyces hydrogenans]